MAVLLNKFEDMSYAEIGEVMNRSPAAVKSLLARAAMNFANGSSPSGHRAADGRHRLVGQARREPPGQLTSREI